MPPLHSLSEESVSSDYTDNEDDAIYDASPAIIEGGDKTRYAECFNAQRFAQLQEDLGMGFEQGAIKTSSFEDEDCPVEVGDLPSQALIDEPDEILEFGARPGKRRKLEVVRSSELVYPKSLYKEEDAPPLPIMKERHVVKEFLEKIGRHGPKRVDKRMNDADFIEFELHDFSIYLPGVRMYHALTMRGLETLATKSGHSWYCFDGVLSFQGVSHYVRCVPFKICSVGNYGKEFDAVEDNIWLQSDSNTKSDIYYRLKSPSPEYRRYHEGFLWIANLGKHFVDYAQNSSETSKGISIHDFRHDFALWLEKLHGESSAFQLWYQKYDSKDFRRAIAANVDFLWKESTGTFRGLLYHPIWAELMPNPGSMPTMKNISSIPPTVVTPYVYDCFSHMKFGHLLKAISPIGDAEVLRRVQAKALNLSIDREFDRSSRSVQRIKSSEEDQLAQFRNRKALSTKIMSRKLDLKSICIGDVLAVPTDGAGSVWRDETTKWKMTDDCWYVYVQRIHIDRRGERSFDVLWLYQPSDTICALMKYPYENELFLSDNCSCGRGRITEREVMGRASIAWNGNPDSNADFFIRQTYFSDGENRNSFITLQAQHNRCLHLREDNEDSFQSVLDKYKIGDTVLVVPPELLKPAHGLEPCEIIDFVKVSDRGLVTLRRLLRRCEVDTYNPARPNELVYSDEIFTTDISRIERGCLVRCFGKTEADQNQIPTPYDRGGTGDAFFITATLEKDGMDQKLRNLNGNDFPTSLKQGFDPSARPDRRPLRGFDMFCGGGNFGRGLEEGGAVRFRYAVDLNGNAIRTYSANVKEPGSTEIFLGSVDDLLAEVLRGNPTRSKRIPLPGQVEFIAAGSPCQGFSLLNSKRSNENGLKNQSLVASVAAHIDEFRPKYALLENVISMAQKGRGRDHDVLSQLICCMVGMGYQVQLFTLDSWSFGSPQSRTRLFVSATAPGLELLQHPPLSHSHPEGTKDRGLGKMANGQAYGQRRFEPTPFEYVTAAEATADLPDLGDGRQYHCTPHPDHRMSIGISRLLQTQIETIPLFPYGMNFAKTWESGWMTQAERRLFPNLDRKGGIRQSVMRGSKAWERVHPQKLFPTIATAISPACNRNGRALHWDQQRLITVMEVRRAQGFPDDEVLTGHPKDQWKIIGNSVARTVSLALGLSLREAWLKNPSDDNIENGAGICNTSKYHALSSDLYESDEAISNIVEFSSNGADFSEGRHERSLDKLGLKSSVSRDNQASSVTSDSWSDKEIGSLQPQLNQHQHIMKNFRKKTGKTLFGPSSKRDPRTLWEPASQISTTTISPKTGRVVLRKTGTQGHPLPSSLKKSSFEPQTLMKRLQLLKVQRDQEPEELNVIQPGSTTTTDQTHGIVSSAIRTTHSTTTRMLPSPHPSATNREVIDLVSDDDGDAEDEGGFDSDDVQITSVRRKHASYIPLDNSMFAAYQQTHDVMRRTATNHES